MTVKETVDHVYDSYHILEKHLLIRLLQKTFCFAYFTLIIVFIVHAATTSTYLDRLQFRLFTVVITFNSFFSLRYTFKIKILGKSSLMHVLRCTCA